MSSDEDKQLATHMNTSYGLKLRHFPLPLNIPIFNSQVFQSSTSDQSLRMRLPNFSGRLLPDFILTLLIKSCSSVLLSELISTLADLSFSEGIFPTRFKLALFSPLIKKEAPSNYRTILNRNNNISKILERLLLARIQAY